MFHTISEPDWRVFRELRPVALDRLCQRVLDELQCEIARKEKTSHQRYLTLYKLIKARDHDIARGFNEFSRSSALGQMGIIHSMGLFTNDELKRFSTEALQVIEFFGPIPKP